MSFDDEQFTRGDRATALDTQLGEIRLVAQNLARHLAGSDHHGHSLQRTIEDGIYASVFTAYLPLRWRWEQDVVEGEAWLMAEALREDTV